MYTSHRSVTQFGHIGGTNVSLGRASARAMLSINHRLIHMGDWRDLVVATNE